MFDWIFDWIDCEPEFDYIRSHYSKEELLTRLAEEASELAQAALELRKAMEDKPDTPVSIKDAKNNLDEEIIDVFILLDMLHLCAPYKRSLFDAGYVYKIQRWYNRIRKQEPNGACGDEK